MNQNHDDADPRLDPPANHGDGSPAGADQVTERQAELLGAAAANDLSPAEQQELDALCAQDPRLAQELRQLRQTSSALSQHSRGWNEEAPPEQLRARVLAAVNAPTPVPTTPTAQPAPARPNVAHPAPGTEGTRRAGTRRTRSRRTMMLAAASVALGVAATLSVQAVLDSDPTDTGSDSDAGLLAEQPSGAPGELGVQEPVSFTTDPDLAGEDAESGAEVTVDGALVAHTWGTETVLEMTGLPMGGSYSVVLVGEDGQEIESGSFLGSERPVECRMNGALLREDVDRLEIRAEDGTPLTSAELPDVD